MQAKSIAKFNADLVLAGDKSITHRAIMFNSIAEGEAKISDALLGDDCISTIECMRRLGANIEVSGSNIFVKGTGRLNSASLNVGNSGTTLRLLMGLLAGKNVSATITGDESICRRPIDRVAVPLRLMGASVQDTNGFTPCTISPSSLHGIEYTLPVLSAQLKSAILLAGISAEGTTTVTEKACTRNHTELMLGAMGADISVCGNSVSVKKSSLRAIDINVPADISSATYFLVLASVLPNSKVTLRNVGVNPTRTGILDVLKQAGGCFTLNNAHKEGGEDVADIVVSSSNINPFVVEGDIVPRLIDEIPALCVLACFAKGVSVIRNAEELKVKESNRILTVVNAINSLGGRAEPTNDGMVIYGTGSLEGGAEIDANNDHRIAMSMFIAGLLSKKGCRVKGGECASISFPNFYSIFSNS